MNREYSLQCTFQIYSVIYYSEKTDVMVIINLFILKLEELWLREAKLLAEGHMHI